AIFEGENGAGRGCHRRTLNARSLLMENYFNYFTEIEEYFWKKRGTSLFLSTLDWALIDTWKEAQIPLEAVLKGIDRAFEKHESRRHKVRQVNSLAYCQQAVLEALQEQQRSTITLPSSEEPFPRGDLAKYFSANAASLDDVADRFEEQGRPESAATFRGLSASLRELQFAVSSDSPLNLQQAEQRLTVLEEKMFSTLQAAADEETL